MWIGKGDSDDIRKKWGGAGEPTINNTYCHKAGTPQYIKMGRIVQFNTDLLIAKQDIPVYTPFVSGLPRAKINTRIVGQVGIGQTTTGQTFGVNINGSISLYDGGPMPNGTYFYVSGTYISEE